MSAEPRSTLETASAVERACEALYGSEWPSMNGLERDIARARMTKLYATSNRDAPTTEGTKGFWTSMSPWLRELIGRGDSLVDALYNEPNDAIDSCDTGNWIQTAIEILKKAHALSQQPATVDTPGATYWDLWDEHGNLVAVRQTLESAESIIAAHPRLRLRKTPLYTTQQPAAAEPDGYIHYQTVHWVGCADEPISDRAGAAFELARREGRPFFLRPPPPAAETLAALADEWSARALQHLDEADPDDEADIDLHNIMAGAIQGCAGQLRTALRVLERQLQQPAAVYAKPLTWQEEKLSRGAGWREWTDRLMGFHISFDPEDEPGSRYTASWGEGEPEDFATLEEAKTWCQSQADTWIRECASARAHLTPLLVESETDVATHHPAAVDAAQQPAPAEEAGVPARVADVLRIAAVEDDRFPGGFADAIRYIDNVEADAGALYEQVFGIESDGSETGLGMLAAVAERLKQPTAVDEAMVEVASEAAWPAFRSRLDEIIWSRGMPGNRERLKTIVRAALTAALAGQQGDAGNG